ncbi:MAG: hypothetical protein HKN82_11715 [Akkermansiaceae bacterium]|nr:hypothetical protein [Akkermansiaceae bacterium]NNM31049.1 hypothetical protein [Akkermansiaceae bacterium]
MFSPDDIQYALETTNVLHEPDRRIDTFGSTRFEFQLLSELMDSVGTVRIRTGEVEASRPQIIRPEAYTEVEFDGFSDDARRLFEWMQDKGYDAALLKYGFQFRRGEVHEELIHDRIETVRERVLEDARKAGNPLQAVIEGVDDAWEISVLRFTFEMVRESHGINVFDFKRKGLL